MLLLLLLGSLLTLCSCGGSFVRRCHAGMQSSEIAHHLLVELLLIGVNGLGMLAEIVKSRELLGAVATERALASVFPGAV